MKSIWRRWKLFAHRLIDYQNRVLMGLVYVVAVAPVALVFRLLGSQLIDRAPADPDAESFWVPRTEPALDMARANRMF